MEKKMKEIIGTIAAACLLAPAGPVAAFATAEADTFEGTVVFTTAQ
jgi:hypothetical protein